jgi:hypothetical protein
MAKNTNTAKTETKPEVKASTIQGDVQAMYKEHGSWSKLIKFLSSQGHSRAAIAKFTGKRYQHVRNVLTAKAKKSQEA